MLRFRPSFSSFVGSLAYSLSPAIVVGIVRYFKGPHLGVAIGIGSALMLLLAFFLCVQDVFVHLVQLELSSAGIRRFGGPTAAKAMLWNEVTEATLRERNNPVSRTDRFLILKSQRGMLGYPLSILSPSDESKVLEELKNRTRLVVMQDRPAI